MADDEGLPAAAQDADGDEPPKKKKKKSPIKRPSWIDRVQPVRFAELFEKYRRLVVHRETGLPFDPTRPRAGPLTLEGLAFETGSGLQLALKVFFPVCATAFLLTFVWDMHPVIRSCAVAGMIGFGTNWVAIKMLFWPRERRPVFGHGLIPSQRDQLIEKVANEVLEKLINEKLINEKIEETRVVSRFTDGLIEKLREVIRHDDFKADLRNMILTYVGELADKPEFRRAVAKKAEASLIEFTGGSFKTWVFKRFKDLWRPTMLEVINREIEAMEETIDSGVQEMDGVLERLPLAMEKRREAIDRVLTTMLMGLVREVDVRAIVFEQLATVTPQQLEEGFREFSDDKLSFITLLGGLLGLVGGTVIIWPIPSLAVLAVLGAMMTVADVVAQPLMRSRYWPQRAERPKQRAAEAEEGGRRPAPEGGGRKTESASESDPESASESESASDSAPEGSDAILGPSPEDGDAVPAPTGA